MKNRFLLFCFLLLFAINTFPQDSDGDYSVLFYNTENFFDVTDDPETLDEEFTPRGDRRWTYNRFNKKLLDISKVILNASGWTPPQMIALCEVENRYVLEKLLSDTPLQEFPYKIIHKESPDHRGIDVAFLYNSDVFYPLEYRFFPLENASGEVLKSREILYVSGIVHGTDTLHLFANHWPSRYSGLLESQPRRNLAAQILRERVENLQEANSNPKIIIVGDFNDPPDSESITEYLGAESLSGDLKATGLYNLAVSWEEGELGTLKYQSQWSVFDQVIVSGTLLNENNSLFTRPGWAEIVQLPFLLEDDERYGGIKTKRTYTGFRYNGGFSDHLPVLLKLRAYP